MRYRKLGPFEVSALGLGCMNLSHAYGVPPSAEQAERILRAAFDAGVNFFDTAALYGFGANEELLGRVLKPIRQALVLATKGGMAGVQFPDGIKRVINGRPEAIRKNCEDSLKKLQTDVIDLYYLHRWDKKVPIEDSVGEMARLVERGCIRYLGLSEVSAITLRKAHAVHPIAAVQTEYSLWTRNPEISLLSVCRELDIGFVAFSPLGRAFLTGGLTDLANLEAKDIRHNMPRFYPDNYAKNLNLLPPFKLLAHQVGCTPAQLALVWLLRQGQDIIPIPGTTRLEHLSENLAAADLDLSAQTLAKAETLIYPAVVSGQRYNAQSQSEVDTETYHDETSA
jgi:aryl-alcohol dehydrogenase-like predicted oxidoreductase